MRDREGINTPKRHTRVTQIEFVFPSAAMSTHLHCLWLSPRAGDLCRVSLSSMAASEPDSICLNASSSA